MNQQFSNGPGFPSNYLAGGRQHSGSASSTPPTHPSNYPARHGPHTLPPIATSQYGPALAQDSYASRAQPLQPTLPTSGPSLLNQPALMPIYAPTATTYFSNNGPVSTYSQSPASQHPYRTSASQYAPQNQQNPPQPSSTHSSRLPDLRPMPIQTISAENAIASKNGRSLASAKPIVDDAQPVHVVGSQGRRGILPSAAGRPPAIGENAPNAQKGPAAPAKDADGKFPCEHCPKTYLHAKHLKRHMLRRRSSPPPLRIYTNVHQTLESGHILVDSVGILSHVVIYSSAISKNAPSDAAIPLEKATFLIRERTRKRRQRKRRHPLPRTQPRLQTNHNLRLPLHPVTSKVHWI